MAIPMIGITPLQYNPVNSLLDTSGVVRGLNDYRRGAIESQQSQEIARAGRLGPEAGYQHLMSVGLPEQARAMGLYPLQRDALTAESALARARAVSTRDENLRAQQMAPWQRVLAMQQARHLVSQGRLAEAQAILSRIQGQTAETDSQLRRGLMNDLLGGPGTGQPGTGLGPVDMGSYGVWNPMLTPPPGQ